MDLKKIASRRSYEHVSDSFQETLLKPQQPYSTGISVTTDIKTRSYCSRTRQSWQECSRVLSGSNRTSEEDDDSTWLTASTWQMMVLLDSPTQQVVAQLFFSPESLLVLRLCCSFTNLIKNVNSQIPFWFLTFFS